MLLSIAMIVKNEERFLNESLEALNSLNDKIDYEIIIVDTGSEDNTINIAKKYTNNIYQKEWTDNFSEMRNYSISKCKGEWILVLDADEVLEDANELVKFLKDKESENFNLVTLKRKEIITDKEDEYIITYIDRLFRNKKEFYYTGRIHEQLKVLPPKKITNISLLHYGYSLESFKLMNYKYERNLKLLLEDLKENDKNPYIYFQLAQTYGMANMNDKAFESITKAYNLIKNERSQDEYLYIYHLLIQILFFYEQYEKVIELGEKAISYKKDHLDFYYYVAKSYSVLDKYENAKFYYDEYFKLHKKILSGYMSDDISVSNKSFSNINNALKDRFMISFKDKDYQYILENYEKYQKDDMEYFFIYSFIMNKKYEYVFKYYKNRKLNCKSIDNIILVCEKINKETLDDNILKIYINLLGLNSDLDNYINYIYRGMEIYDIDFENFYLYKSTILKKYIIENKGSLEKIKNISKIDICNYLIELTKDYRGIEILYKYSKDKFLSNNIEDLRFLVIIEDVLIKNNSIDYKEYNSLVYRCFINKINYINSKYNKNIIFTHYKKICNKDEIFFIELLDLFNMYSIDKYKYIKILRRVINEYPEYNILINHLKESIEINHIDYNNILKEKETLVKNIQILIENNMIEQAKEVLEEIKDIFKYDSKINNLLGIINYLNKDYDNSLIYLGLANILKDDDFDSAYNLGLILEELDRKNDSKFYYKKAINLCNDEFIKSEILKKI